MTKAALLLIRAYQLLVSPLIPSCCRFAPSCSHYASQALRRYGFRRGVIMAGSHTKATALRNGQVQATSG